ncbi:TPA: hypothetical protein DCZ39_01160 [Patescibacteria group bacterium]|nr:hypothetical protein [Candidatus Gracilibacteria bacterium]
MNDDGFFFTIKTLYILCYEARKNIYHQNCLKNILKTVLISRLYPAMRDKILKRDILCFFIIDIMNQEEKVFVRNNLIKLIIGLILLGFSFSYIQNHPAEKASIFSGFQVLWQRAVVYVHKLTNTDSDAFQKKYDYEKTYEELINMAENKECVDSSVLNQIKATYAKLKNE